MNSVFYVDKKTQRYSLCVIDRRTGRPIDIVRRTKKEYQSLADKLNRINGIYP
jgi:hypothetical protein